MEYFVSPYSDYAAKFANKPNMSVVIQEYEENVNIILEQSQSAQEVVSGWKGLSADTTINESVQQLSQYIEILQNNIEASLSPAITAMDALSSLLVDMEAKDKILEEKKNELNTEENKNIEATITTSETVYNPETGMNETREIRVDNPDYAPWKAKIDALINEIKELRKVLAEIKADCDTNIETITTLDGQVKDLEGFIESFTSQFDDSQNLTLEEREAMFQAILDGYYKRYNELFASYNILTCDDEKLEKLCIVAFLLGDDLPLSFGDGYFGDPTELVEFIDKCEKYKVFDVIERYLSGESWEESGMADLVREGGAFDPQQYDNVTEEVFLERYNEQAEYYNNDHQYWGENIKHSTETDLRNLFKDVNDYYKVIKVQKEEYEQNVIELVELSNQIREVENYKTIMKYIDMVENPDFEEKSNVSLTDDEWLVIFYDDYEHVDIDLQSVYENLNDAERKILNYIYNTSEDPNAEVTEFLAGCADTVFRRIGTEKGREFVKWIADNPHTDPNDYWKDHIADYANVFGKGTLHGIERYGDYLMSSISPSKVQEPLYYEIAEIANLLTNDPETRMLLGEGKADALAATYTAGTIVGEKAIPILATKFCGGGIANLLGIVATTGKSREANYQSGVGYWESLGIGLVDGSINYGTKCAIEKIPGLKQAMENSIDVKIGVDTGQAMFINGTKQGARVALAGEEFDFKELCLSGVEGATKSTVGIGVSKVSNEVKAACGEKSIVTRSFDGAGKEFASETGKGVKNYTGYAANEIKDEILSIANAETKGEHSSQESLDPFTEGMAKFGSGYSISKFVGNSIANLADSYAKK